MFHVPGFIDGRHLVHLRPCQAAGNIVTKKCMAAGARGIGETSHAVQLNGFFWEIIYFYNLFSQSATLPVSFFVS